MVGSITMLGYLLMAMLYHWPFGGWRRQYGGLRDLYQRDPDAAVARFNRSALRRRTASGIGL
jgi:dolichol-phosphate mannosyltransferase